MSKKLEAIKKEVFYSKENPEKLATIISGLITDVATDIVIEGNDSIEIPETGNATATYIGKTYSQYGDAMDNATLALKSAVTGVSISEGTVTVASTCTAESFTIQATSGSKTAEKVVELTTTS